MRVWKFRVPFLHIYFIVFHNFIYSLVRSVTQYFWPPRIFLSISTISVTKCSKWLLTKLHFSINNQLPIFFSLFLYFFYSQYALFSIPNVMDFVIYFQSDRETSETFEKKNANNSMRNGYTMRRFENDF